MSVSPSPAPRFGQEVRATATLALPLVRAAVNFLNEMASFESAGVSDQDAAQ